MTMARLVFFTEAMIVCLIERCGSSNVDDLGADAALDQRLRRRQAHLHHAAGGDESDIVPWSFDVCDAERNHVFFRRHRTFELIHQLVFEKDHRVVVADR